MPSVRRHCLLLLTASASACAADDGSGSTDPQLAELVMRIDELESAVTTLQTSVTDLNATVAEQAAQLPVSLGRISLACSTASACTVDGFSFGNHLSHPGGGLRFTIPNTSGKTVLVTGRINLVMTAGATTDSRCQYIVTRSNVATYGLVRGALFSIPAGESLELPLTFAATYIDGSEDNINTNLIEVTFASVQGGATCSLADYETAEFNVIAFDGLPAM